VGRWCVSERPGCQALSGALGEVCLGILVGGNPKPQSDETARAIDEEVRRIIDECYARATDLLTENEDKLHSMASALIEFETLLPEQIDDIMAGAKPRDPNPPGEGRGSKPGPSEASIGSPAGEH
ncbi:MAG: ATP-dependent metalloprotease, partial [Gammaproteobacteria bacterium]|nr:ATP-dependent metalloprotease [Gammaproteobacteria bacterium]